MARLVRPELTATIVGRQQPGVPGPAMGGPPLPEPTPEQLEALQDILEWLHDTAMPGGEDAEATMADLLFAGDEEVTVQLRRVGKGELWTRQE